MTGVDTARLAEGLHYRGLLQGLLGLGEGSEASAGTWRVAAKVASGLG